MDWNLANHRASHCVCWRQETWLSVAVAVWGSGEMAAPDWRGGWVVERHRLWPYCCGLSGRRRERRRGGHPCWWGVRETARHHDWRPPLPAVVQ